MKTLKKAFSFVCLFASISQLTECSSTNPLAEGYTQLPGEANTLSRSMTVNAPHRKGILMSSTDDFTDSEGSDRTSFSAQSYVPRSLLSCLCPCFSKESNTDESNA